VPLHQIVGHGKSWNNVPAGSATGNQDA